MPNPTSPYQSLQQDAEVMHDIRELMNSRHKVAQFDNLVEGRAMSRRLIADYVEHTPDQTAELARDDAMIAEAIVLSIGRPSLLIADGHFNSNDVAIPSLRQRLEANLEACEKPIPSVGRVEVVSHPDFEWIGTCFLVEEDVLVTNRHVASEFAEKRRGNFVFKRFGGSTISARVDFLEEYRNPEDLEIAVESILYIAPRGAGHPDMAVLKLQRSPGLPPLEMAERDPQPREHIATVGYPAWDGRRNPGADMRRIFQDIYEVKRFAPGQIIDTNSRSFTHDATTMGGNSGSPTYRQEDGKVVGLHFSGRFKSANFAVPISVVKQQLRRATTQVSGLEIDEPLPLESLTDRHGYNESFLGSRRLSVPLPVLSSEQLEDAAPVRGRERDRGVGKYVLDYTHFSVVMNKRRRFAYFAAVNIDGTQEVLLRRTRTRWRIDPRIATDHQYDNSLYRGNRRIHRGHLARRLDPVWGDDNTARQADEDTFHYTNACPQHSRFNPREWLGLEDYLLRNTHRDDQKLTVFTGPVFGDRDTRYRGALIPEEFWKVAVMTHEGRLLATGYLLSQEEFLDDIEFVIGRFRTYQVPITRIEELTGISFGELSQHDPLNRGGESLGDGSINYSEVAGPNDLILS